MIVRIVRFRPEEALDSQLSSLLLLLLLLLLPLLLPLPPLTACCRRLSSGIRSTTVRALGKR